MGDILVVYDVTVEEQEMLDSVEKQVLKINVGKLQKVERVPFVFGTEAIRVAVIVPDKTDGVADAIEDYLNKISGVSSINNVATTLV